MNRLRAILNTDAAKVALSILGVLGGALAAANVPGPWYVKAGASMMAVSAGAGVLSSGTSGTRPPPA